MTAEGTELPRSIGNVARRELAVHHVTRFAHLTEWTEREVLAIHGVGPRAVRIVRAALQEQGLDFRDE